MNYQKIKSELQRVWDEFEKWIHTANGEDESCFSEIEASDNCLRISASGEYYADVFSDRDLYDYFDSIGIYVCIRISKAKGWEGHIIIKGEKRPGSYDYLRGSRSEAETAAFTRAFQIRNEQLLS